MSEGLMSVFHECCYDPGRMKERKNRLDDAAIEQLLRSGESDRVERKSSASDGDKIRQAICAFANDLPGHGLPGVLFIGVHDDGSCANLAVTDRVLQNLAAMRDDGNIVPLPSMIVESKTINGCEMAVIQVHPADAPPVRYKGSPWIRIGPRRAIATADEERRLAERHRSKDLPYDVQPVAAATLEDLDMLLFQSEYLPAALSVDVLDRNNRPVEHQLMALRFTAGGVPTVVGLLVAGKDPAHFVPGAYVQFVRFDGEKMTDPIKSQQEIRGPLARLLTRLDDLLRANISVATDIVSESREVRHPDYPIEALQQIIRNAIMHRNYETSNAPVRIYWFADRVEIHNPGGPYGQVTRENFGKKGLTDYRNLHIAEAMRNLGFVQRFGVGIQLARKAMTDNGNPLPEFLVEDTNVAVVLRRRP